MDWTYFHLAMNHFPVIGSILAMVILAWGILRGNEEVKKLGLATMIVTALVAVPVFLTGEPAEERVEGLPGVLESVIEQHGDFAKFALTMSIISGVTALFGLIYSRFRTSQSVVGRAMGILTLAISIGTVGAMSWTAKLGGVIRQTEIGASQAVNNTPVETKGADGRNEDDDD